MCTGFSRSRGWLSFRGSARIKCPNLDRDFGSVFVGLWQLPDLAGLQLYARLEPLPASIKGQSITGPGLSPGRALAPRGTMQGLVTTPADQLPWEGDRGQEEARCWGGSGVPQRRDTAGEKGCSHKAPGEQAATMSPGLGALDQPGPQGEHG